VEDVRRDEHGAALLAEVVDQLDDLAAPRRVEAVQRLVEEQDARLVGERLCELDALAHALREAAHAPLGDVEQPDPVERGLRRRVRIGDAPQARHRHDHLARGEERPEGVAVGDDPDLAEDRRVAADVTAEQPHLAAARRGEARAELERRRLAGAVVAEQARHAGAERERDVRDGHPVAVPLRDAVELERRHVAHARLR
jgi:hypothetical protein